MSLPPYPEQVYEVKPPSTCLHQNLVGEEISYFGRSMMSKVSSREDKEGAREARRIGNFIANGVYRRKPYRH